MKAVTGNTYPVRDILRNMGGRWNPTQKYWEVPDDKLEEANKAVANQPKSEPTKTDRIAMAARHRGETPGVCSMCGEKCKYPYTECWDCKEERDMGY